MTMILPLKKGKKEKKQRFRHELKYLVDLGEASRFFEEALQYSDYDKHAGATGMYEIASTYYDTADLRFYFDREESVGYRRKIRLRSYNSGGRSTALFIEIKERHKNFVSKKRIDLRDASVLDCGLPHIKIPLNMVLECTKDSAEAREMYYLHKRLELIPVVIVRYLRRALIPKYEHDMRLTLDTRITSGGESLDIYDEHKETLLTKPHHGVFEIKTNHGIPLWLHSMLNRYAIKHNRFSKYCLGVDAMYGGGRQFVQMLSSEHQPHSKVSSGRVVAMD